MNPSVHTAAGNRGVRHALALWKHSKLLLPTVGTGLIRGSQLLVLLAISNVATGTARDVLVSGFGLLSAFAIMTDSGANNFLLATPEDRLTRHMYGRVALLHIGLAWVGIIAAIAYSSFTADGELTVQLGALLVSLALTQLIDGLARVLRAPILVRRQDHLYALPDFALFLLKVPILALAFLTRELGWLYLMPLCSVVVAVLIYVSVRRSLIRGLRVGSGQNAERRLVPRVLEFGVTGALSSFYSQAPLLVGAAVLPVAQVATLAIAYRVVQAAELIPGTMSSQLIPRVRTRRTSPRAYWALFFAGGAIVAGLLIAFSPLIELIFSVTFAPFFVFVVIAAAFAAKSGNYSLVAFVMGTGLIRARLVVTLAVGIFAVLASIVAANSWGSGGLAFVTPISEVALTFGLWIAIRGPHRKAAE